MVIGQPRSLPPRLNIPVLVFERAWWLFELQPPASHALRCRHYLHLHHPQSARGAARSLCECTERGVGECCWKKSSKVRMMRRGIAPMRGPPLAGTFGAVSPVADARLILLVARARHGEGQRRAASAVRLLPPRQERGSAAAPRPRSWHACSRIPAARRGFAASPRRFIVTGEGAGAVSTL